MPTIFKHWHVACKNPLSSTWLVAASIGVLGTHEMAPGSSWWELPECQLAWGSTMDVFGDHSITCTKQARPWDRHACVVERLHHIATAAGIATRREVPIQKSRDPAWVWPADLQLSPSGHHAVDVTIFHPLKPS